MKGVNVIKKVSVLPRHSLVTICKSFVWLHLVYGDQLLETLGKFLNPLHEVYLQSAILEDEEVCGRNSGS